MGLVFRLSLAFDKGVCGSGEVRYCCGGYDLHNFLILYFFVCVCVFVCEREREREREIHNYLSFHVHLVIIVTSIN